MTRPVDTSLLTRCETFLSSIRSDVEAYLSTFPDTAVFEIAYDDVVAFEYGADLVADWRTHTQNVCDHLSLALKDFISAEFEHSADIVADETTVRITGYDESAIFDVGQYAPDSVAGRLIHLRGQVTGRSKRKLRDEVVAFECTKCGTSTRVHQHGEKLMYPEQCYGCETQGPFQVNESETVMRDYQTIRLQTLPEEAAGTETESLTVRVYDDQVGNLSPGDRCILNVLMKTRRYKDTRIKELEGEIHSMTKLTSDHTDVDIEPYREEIESIAADDPFAALIDSIAPFHTGDEHIKEALALQLFGGVEKELPDSSWLRGNSHMLLMGDPGTGKTSLIRYVSELVPRAEYASGKKSTSAGLTASAVKDEFAEGGWTLQAGTLVRANNGLACIDELDKMDPDDRDGMIQAMSEQRITVTMVVAGVLPAKCSVLAAANPKYGSFDSMKDIGQQLNLDSVILSRFDLWFVMRDEPDEDHDESVATNMTDDARVGQKIAGDHELSASDKAHTETPVPPEMFRAYVAMGKRCYPVFTSDAKDRVVREYVKLRQLNDGDGPVPTTPRIVEGLHRLSEASARIRLSDEVSVEDVERAIRIQRRSLESLGVDPETGELDASRFETGTTTTKHERSKALLAIIEGQTTDDAPASLSDVKEEAMILMTEEQYEETLDRLRAADELYEPEHGSVKRV